MPFRSCSEPPYLLCLASVCRNLWSHLAPHNIVSEVRIFSPPLHPTTPNGLPVLCSYWHCNQQGWVWGPICLRLQGSPVPYLPYPLATWYLFWLGLSTATFFPGTWRRCPALLRSGASPSQSSFLQGHILWACFPQWRDT